MNILLQGYLDRNFGDDIMLRIAAYQLNKHKLYLSEPKKELLLPFKNTANIHDYDEKQPASEFDAVLRVIGSGFVIRNRAGLYYSFRRLMRHEHKGIKSAVLGCNIGPFCGKAAKHLSTLEMKRFNLITVRDSDSHEFLIKNLKNTCTTACFPDITFSIPPEWLKTRTGEDCLGISAYRSRYRNNMDFYTKMAKLSDWYISQTNRKVLLFAFDTEDENDISAAYTIASLSKRRDMIEIIPHTDNGDNILTGFARCKTVIAVRFHSAVLSLRAGLNFIPIIYSEKTTNLLQDIGCQKESFSIDNIDITKIKSIIEKDEKPFEINPDVFEQAKGHINMFANTILKE